MFPIPLNMSVGVGNSHPSKSKSITQIGIFVFEILISSIFSASTSFVTVVVLMSLPASCWFCCPTNCCVFSLPARTLAFTEGPPLLEKGLRKDGIVCEIYPVDVKIKKQLDYANKKGIDFVVIIGDDELKKDIFKVKDMSKGEELTFTQLDSLAEKIKEISFS